MKENILVAKKTIKKRRRRRRKENLQRNIQLKIVIRENSKLI
jgi:hypothetical protein